jgi:hypothetical protein
MASTRKTFLAAVSAAGVGLALREPAEAQTPVPSVKPTAPASPLARDFAERMRRFDPQLTDKQIDNIAHQIDQGFDLRTALRPKGHGLSNGDAPSPHFEVGE